MPGRQQGYTVVELLVAMAIGSLLMTAMVIAFVSTGRLMQWVGVHSDVTTAGLIALDRWSTELRSSSYQTILCTPTPRLAMAFSIEDPTTITLTTFQASNYFVVYYDDGHGNLMRKTWDGTNPTVADNPFASGRLSQLDLTAVLGQTNGSEHILAAGMTAVSVVPATFPMVTGSPSPVDGMLLSLTVQKKTTVQTVETTVYPRNHP